MRLILCVVCTVATLMALHGNIAAGQSNKLLNSVSENSAKIRIHNRGYFLPVTVRTEDIRINAIAPSVCFTTSSGNNVLQISSPDFARDLSWQNSYFYEKSVLYKASDSVRVIRSSFLNFLSNYFARGYPVHKGEIYLYASLPHINSFHFKPVNEGTKRNTGFWGISLGLEYGYAENRFLNLGASGVLDFFLPFPAAVDLIGEHEFMSSRYVSLSNNYKISRFTIGYGLSYAKNIWALKYYDRFDPQPPTREPVKKSHNTFGLVFPVHVQVLKQWHIGVVYRPTFFTPDLKDKFNYEHIISVAFTYKIRLIG